MLNNPKVVLLDEPLSALDPLIVEEVSKYILKIQEKGVSIIMSEHNVKNLFALTDRNYVLGEHTIIAEGSSRELLKSSKAREIYFGSDF
jgi:lipopolysaccharide export system ATP-binding protein